MVLKIDLRKIDLKDRKILYELDKNSRQSNKQIARKVRLSEQVTGNRIKGLINKNVIDYFYVKINPSLLGYMHIKIYFRFHNITKEKEEELFNELNHKKGIFWLASIRGKYDLVCSIYVKNIADFSKRYEDIFEKWGNYILERNVILLEKANTYTKSYLIPKKKSKEIIYTKGKEKTIELDEIDTAILKILNKNGREQLIEIANKINVSSDTIRYRINNLKKKGIITGFGVKINFNKIGNNYHLIFLKLQNMDKEKYAKLNELAKLNRNVIIFIKTIGDHNVELEIETASKEELDELLRILRNNFVLEMKDYEILEVIKEYGMTYFPF